MTKTINLILIAGMTLLATNTIAEQELEVQATTISELENQIEDTKNQISEIDDEIDRLTDEQDLVLELIDDLNAEIVNTMTSIGLKEDEIAVKETELVDKQGEIDVTQAEYEAALDREEQQYADMQVRLRRMYENNSTTFLGHFLAGDGFGDMLNRMDFIEEVYEYDRLKLQEYENTRKEVHDLWDTLELEKTELETAKAQLEADRANLQTQKDNLDGMLSKKKQESANFEAEIKRAKQEAAVAKELLKQEQRQLKELQAQQNKGNTAAANGNYKTTDYTSTIDNAAGSDLGKKAAKYACQYIGNPYVYGGTSLTNGADCSGFTYRVYKDFGYNLPRTSYEQRSAGTGVDYSNAQPGDLICYDGHVGIYIGGGKIVHASNARTGIKVSNANYRTILAVRRIV